MRRDPPSLGAARTSALQRGPEGIVRLPADLPPLDVPHVSLLVAPEDGAVLFDCPGLVAGLLRRRRPFLGLLCGHQVPPIGIPAFLELLGQRLDDVVGLALVDTVSTPGFGRGRRSAVEVVKRTLPQY